MNIIIMGSPDFGIPSFRRILEDKHNIIAAVTTPDKPKGRGLKLIESAVKIFALENNINVLQPESLNDELFFDEMCKLNPDLIVVIAFRILPKKIFALPKYGSINLHASLLPKYRGAAPIQWAIINGDKVSGITTFFIEEKVDTGKIILQKEILIEPEDNYGSLYHKMSLEGADLVSSTIKLIQNGQSNSSISQISGEYTQAPKITKENTKIIWNRSANTIHNLVRALSPIPNAYTTLNTKIIKINKTFITDIPSTSSPGKIDILDGNLAVHTGDKILFILELKIEGKKLMTSKEFLNGYPYVSGSIFV